MLPLQCAACSSHTSIPTQLHTSSKTLHPPPFPCPQASTQRCPAPWPPLPPTCATAPRSTRRAATASTRSSRRSTSNAVSGAGCQKCFTGMRGQRGCQPSLAVLPEGLWRCGACSAASRPPASFHPAAAAPELGALAVSKLDSALREIEVTGAADYIAQHAPHPRARGRRHSEAPHPSSAAGAGAGGEGSAAPTREASEEPSAAPTEGTQQTEQQGASQQLGEGVQQRQPTDSVRDLTRCVRFCFCFVGDSWQRRPRSWIIAKPSSCVRECPTISCPSPPCRQALCPLQGDGQLARLRGVLDR